jgi:hypothetical protein
MQTKTFRYYGEFLDKPMGSTGRSKVCFVTFSTVEFDINTVEGLKAANESPALKLADLPDDFILTLMSLQMDGMAKRIPHEKS